MKNISSCDPVLHARNISDALHEAKIHCREDVKKIKDPEAKALFEKTAHELETLEKALIDYQIKQEESWKDSSQLAESWGE